MENNIIRFLGGFWFLFHALFSVVIRKTLLALLIIGFLRFSTSRASDFGLMKIDNKGRVMSFSEKPKGDDLKAMVCPLSLSHSLHLILSLTLSLSS